MTGQRGLVVKGGRVIDPAQNIDRFADVLIEGGRVASVADSPYETIPDGYEVIDANGLVVAPGFIDLHTHLRVPGEEHKETIASGTLAAARGGFTTVCAMPNTHPALDRPSVINLMMKMVQGTAAIRVLPIAAVTMGRNGEQLTNFSELASAGVVGFSDDGDPVYNPSLMRHALERSVALELPIINHCQELSMTRGAQINDGVFSSRLGLIGWPGQAEAHMVFRDIGFAEETGGRLHIAHISTKESVRYVREAKARGVDVTAEATPHHLILNDAWVLGTHGDTGGDIGLDTCDTSAKVNPPLRSEGDREEIEDALVDGTIDFIATDHAPHAESDKSGDFEAAENGISSLETAFGLVMGLVHGGAINLVTLIDRLTASPAKFLAMELGSLKPGFPADLVLLDLNMEWVVKSEKFASLGKNTPLDGVTLRGRVVTTIFNGRMVYSGKAGDL